MNKLILKVDQLSQIVWNYHLMHHELIKADAILVLGSHDLRVAERGADLFLQGWAPLMIFSGGLTTNFPRPEAEVFADIAIQMGVPADKIILEEKSTNTGENIEFTKGLIKNKGLDIKSLIVVQKPYMERRTYATFKKFWQSKKFIVTSPQISFLDYCNDQYPKERIINLIVGDLDRIIKYPSLGYQIKQNVPPKVMDAYKKLIDLGYTKNLVKKVPPRKRDLG